MSAARNCFLSRASRGAVLLAAVTTLSPPPGAAESQELGRLFFSPERRQALDHMRQFNIQERGEASDDPSLTINGIVTRSSGKRTVWINGVAQDANNSSNVTTVTPNRANPGEVVVQTDSNYSTRARVGDTISRGSGETTDLLKDGNIRVHRTQKR